MYRSTNSHNEKDNFKHIDENNQPNDGKNPLKEGGSQNIMSQNNLAAKKKESNLQSKLGNRNNSNKSIDSMYNRPRSSNSHGRILQAQGP